MAAPVDKSLVDCYWFITSQCTKGDTCEYRHIDAAKNNTTICKYWVNGQCNNKTCSFRHPSQVRSTTPCVFYLAGMCTKGASCPYTHSNPNEAQSVKPQETVLPKAETKPTEQNKPNTQKEAKPKQTKASAPPPTKTTDTKPNQDSPQLKQQQQKQTIKNIVKASVAGNTSNDGKKVPAKKATAPAAKQTTAPKQTAQAPKAKATKPPIKIEAQPNFGIKSLDELMKEKGKDTPKPETKQEENNVSTNNGNNVVANIDEIRKRNQQKFHTQNATTTSPTGTKRKADTINNNTPAASQQPVVTPTKDITTSQDPIKKPKTSDSDPQQSIDVTVDPTSEDFDLDKELEQIGVEGLNDEDLNIEDFDVDDLDAIQT